MSAVLDAAVEYVASTARWSTEAARPYIRGTLWYGIMARSFLLLERVLRSCMGQLSIIVPNEIKVASKFRAQSKSLEEMTFGQLLGVAEQVASDLPALLVNKFSNLRIPLNLLTNEDRTSWKLLLALRNQITHEGPGFFDSVDFGAGRVWRKYTIDKPLGEQADEVWEIGRHLCRSPLVMTCIEMQGVSEETALIRLESAEKTPFTLNDIRNDHTDAINALHESARRQTRRI
jgi:hypothetical protein